MQLPQCTGHAGIVTLIRRTKQNGALRVMKDVLLQDSTEKIKKQQEGTYRVINELWEEDERAKAAATTG